MIFSDSEIKQRLQRVQLGVKEAGLDALVVSADANINYLTGLYGVLGERVGLLVVPACAEPVLIVPRLELEPYSQSPSVSKVISYWEKDSGQGRNWFDVLDKTLGDVGQIGVDPAMSVDMTCYLGSYTWVVSHIVEQERIIKSVEEIAVTRRVASYWSSVMNRMLSIAKAGLAVEDLMRLGGTIADEVFANEPDANWINSRFIQFFQCSPASSSPHHVSYRPDDMLPDGPSIFNVIGSVCGYHAENERTILLGRYTPEQEELFDITSQAHAMAINMIRPGVPCSDVDIAIQDYFSEQGVSQFLRHRTGHGFGLQDQEAPYISEGSEHILKPGMLISIEPGLYVNGVGGFRHSDTVLVTNEGKEVLTRETPISHKDVAQLSIC